MTIGCIVCHLNGNYLLRLLPVTLEWLSPKLPRKNGHFNLVAFDVHDFDSTRFKNIDFLIYEILVLNLTG
jgi:hypothetical protein